MCMCLLCVPASLEWVLMPINRDVFCEILTELEAVMHIMHVFLMRPCIVSAAL